MINLKQKLQDWYEIESLVRQVRNNPRVNKELLSKKSQNYYLKYNERFNISKKPKYKNE